LAFRDSYRKNSFLAVHKCTVRNPIRGYAKRCRNSHAGCEKRGSPKLQATRLLPELLLQGLGSAALQWISTKRGPPAADNYNVEF